MSFDYFSRNGELLPADQAVVPLANIAYAYGFGVYETIRVTRDVPYFLEQHAERLLTSAELIGLEHDLSHAAVEAQVRKLVDKLAGDTYNLKLLLVGGKSTTDYLFDITASNPLFPDRKLYKDGAKLITYRHERAIPHAKSLSMFESYRAYREATQADAYDALLVNDEDFVTEGTRTNFFMLDGTTIISPPAEDILLGVMRLVVLQEAQRHGFSVTERPLKLSELKDHEAAFVTSTSSKVMPVRAVDDITFGAPTEQLRELMRLTDEYLSTCAGQIEA